MDNAPEFIAGMLSDWSSAHEIESIFIQSGCPTQNAYVERLNGCYRRSVLDAHFFERLNQVRAISETWVHYNNNVRPHDSPKNLPPVVFGAQLTSVASPRSDPKKRKNN
jgi:putative transposase